MHRCKTLAAEETSPRVTHAPVIWSSIKPAELSFLATFWRVIRVNTSYPNCLEFIILFSNRWLKIEVTERHKKSVFPRCRVTDQKMTTLRTLSTASPTSSTLRTFTSLSGKSVGTVAFVSILLVTTRTAIQTINRWALADHWKWVKQMAAETFRVISSTEATLMLPSGVGNQWGDLHLTVSSFHSLPRPKSQLLISPLHSITLYNY